MRGKSFIVLEDLAGGAFAEKMQEALLEVAENIQNPNTDPTAKRKITATLTFAPDSRGEMVSTTIQVVTKLAPTEAIDTTVLVGRNHKTGEVEIAEYSRQVRGQTGFQDIPTWEEPEGAKPAAGPIDLRARARKRELEPGTDFDTETGEVYDGANVLEFDRAVKA